MNSTKRICISVIAALAVAAAAVFSTIGFGSAVLNEDTERAQAGHCIMVQVD